MLGPGAGDVKVRETEVGKGVGTRNVDDDDRIRLQTFEAANGAEKNPLTRLPIGKLLGNWHPLKFFHFRKGRVPADMRTLDHDL